MPCACTQWIGLNRGSSTRRLNETCRRVIRANQNRITMPGSREDASRSLVGRRTWWRPSPKSDSDDSGTLEVSASADRSGS